MEVITSYCVKTSLDKKLLKNTVLKYREAVSFFVNIELSEWSRISSFHSLLDKRNYVESLCIESENKLFKSSLHYPMFDITFYKFPTLLRHYAVNESLRIVDSCMKSFDGEISSPELVPKSIYENLFPILFENEMHRSFAENSAELLLFQAGSWKWVQTQFDIHDISYMKNNTNGFTRYAPVLSLINNEWVLDYQYSSSLKCLRKSKNPLVVIASLGINCDCICSLVDNGTVISRKFLRMPAEEAELEKTLDKVTQSKKNQFTRDRSGICEINKKIADSISGFIYLFAKDNQATHIILESREPLNFTNEFNLQYLYCLRTDQVKLNIDKRLINSTRLSLIPVRSASSAFLCFEETGKKIQLSDFHNPE